jgi:hypothetical protein
MRNRLEQWPTNFLKLATGVIPISILNFLVSLLGIVAIYFLIAAHSPDPIIKDIFIAIAIYIVTEKVQGFFSAVAERNLHLEIAKLTERSVNVSYVGTHKEGLHYCAGKMRRALRFQDTLFRTKPDEVNRSHSETTTLFYKSVADMLCQGGSFECLISEGNWSLFQDVMAPYQAQLDKAQSLARIHVCLIQHTAPLMGMQILTYSDAADDVEVVFGWNYHAKDIGLVFSTRDRRLVKYFSDMYSETERGGSCRTAPEIFGGAAGEAPGSAKLI